MSKTFDDVPFEKMMELLNNSRHEAASKPEPLNSYPVAAKKNDTGKPQLSLVPREALEEMAKGFAYGANKYGRYNYELGHKYSRLLDAALRHISAIQSGEFTDAESGNTHLSHALCSLAMLAFNFAHHPDNDDLTRKPK